MYDLLVLVMTGLSELYNFKP